MPRRESPQIILAITELFNSKRITGTKKDKAVKSLNRKVEIVETHICFSEYLFSDSFDMWIPSASDKESANAMVKIPPITASLECVPELKPTRRPRVVMMPDVSPKLKPVLRDSLTILMSNIKRQLKLFIFH